MLFLFLTASICWANSFEPIIINESQEIISLENIECNDVNDLLKTIKPKKYYCSNASNTLVLQDDSTVLKNITNIINQIDANIPTLSIEVLIVIISNNSQIKNYLTIPTSLGELYTDNEINWPNLVNTLFNLEKKNMAKIIASPRLHTLNNNWAIIETGQEIPILTVSKTNSDLKYKKAVFNCKIKANLNKKEDIKLSIELKQDSLSSSSIDKYPILNTNTIQTSTSGKLNQVFTIAGLTQINKTTQSYGPAQPIYGRKNNLDFNQILIFVRVNKASSKS